MAEIKLLAAPVILPPTSEANSASASLVPVSRLPAINRATARNDTAYPNDRFVWSVSAGEDGSFHFYAVPLRNPLNSSASSQQDGFLSDHEFPSGWNALNTSSAAAQYQLCASLPMPMLGHLLNVYA